MIRCKRLYIIIVWIVLWTSAYSQTTVAPTVLREEVKNLFDKKVKNVWVLLLSGKLDGMHVIDIALGTDGKNCRGFYYLRSSGERFELEGDEDKESFTLIESTKRGRTSGFILAKFDGQNFSGQWMDVYKKFSLSFEANVVNSFEDYAPKLCEERAWHLFYQGKIENVNTLVHIDKYEDQYFIFSKYGESVSRDTFHNFSSSEALVFNLAENHRCILTSDALEFLVVENQENFQNFLLNQEAKAIYECFEYINFTTRIETQRPVIKHKKFALWLDQEFKKWYDHDHKKVNPKNEESISNKYRYKDVGFGWVEISFINDEWVSGNIFTQSSWKKGTEKKSFIYDLKQSKIINPETLFMSSPENLTVMDAMIREKINLLYIKDVKVKDWVLKQKFNYLLLHKTGISFETGFSNIYGEHKILLTYEDLQPFFKNKSFFKNF